MSYTIIKSMSIRNGKVYLTAAESNVRPIAYRNYEVPHYTALLQKRGKNAVLAELLVKTEGDVFIPHSKLDKLRFFVFEWHLANKFTSDSLRDQKTNEYLVAILERDMPQILQKFREECRKEEPHVVLVHGKYLTRMRADAEWARYQPGTKVVKAYNSPFVQYAERFPNRFEAEYVAKDFLVPLFRRVEIESLETGVRTILKAMVKLDWEYIGAIFRRAQNQGEALEALYRMVFGADWLRTKKLHGYPAMNPEDHQQLSKMFMEFDREHHPNVLPGGLWLNSGFSSSNFVPKGQVDLSGCVLEFEPEEAPRRSVRKGASPGRSV